jgi:membrane protein DedA with SNARE-associated domain
MEGVLARCTGRNAPVGYAEPLPEPSSPRLRSSVLGLFGVVTVLSLVGTALAPYLLVKSPLLLVALSPAAHHVALAAASVAPLPLIVVATLRRALTGIAAYGVGYVFGAMAQSYILERSPRLAKLLAFADRQLRRFGAGVLILAPVPTVALLFGAAHGRVAPFVCCLLVGLALWSSVTYYLGEALSRWTNLVTATLDENLLESTLICISVVVAQQTIAHFLRRRKARA